MAPLARSSGLDGAIGTLGSRTLTDAGGLGGGRARAAPVHQKRNLRGLVRPGDGPAGQDRPGDGPAGQDRPGEGLTADALPGGNAGILTPWCR
jgi:hypothetical protein